MTSLITKSPIVLQQTGLRGESFADVARRVGQFAGNPVPTDATDAEVLDTLTDSLTEVVAAAGYTVITAVRATTTVNITLADEQTIDGVDVVAGDRVLVKDQTLGETNGIYVVVAGGVWTRATDFDTSTEVVTGSYVPVLEGTQAGAFVLVTQGTIVVGTTVQTWRLFDYRSLAKLRFRQLGATTTRTGQDKLRETVSVTDFGAISGQDVVAATNAAMASFAGNPGTLVFPSGTWLIGTNVDWSTYRNVAIRIEPGAVIDQGANTVKFPEKVDADGLLAGTGTVTAVNKDATPPTPSPGDGFVQYGNRSLGGIGSFDKATSGVSNLAWGDRVLSNLTKGSGNIGIGADALVSVTGDDIVAEGTSGRHGWYNIGIGLCAGRDILLGYENTYIGSFTGIFTVNGRWNVAVGDHSQCLNQNGEGNTSLGAYCLTLNSGNNNVAIGWATLEKQSVGSNIAIGYVAMNQNVDGSLNTAVGTLAMQKSASGDENAVLGNEALKNATDPQGCTAVGAYALGQATGSHTNATAVGRNALLMATTGDGNTGVGAGSLSTLVTYTNCFGLGVSAQVTGSNQGQLGNSLVTTYYYGLQERSDERDKADIRDTVLGLDFIKALRPVDYRLDMRDDYRAPEPLRPAIDVPRRPEVPVEPRGQRGQPLSDKSPKMIAYKAALAAYPAAEAKYQAELATYNNEIAKHQQAMAAWAEDQQLRNVKRDGSKKRKRFHHGLIAQEVQRVIEKTGVDFGGFQDHKVNGGDDVLSLGYIELIAPLIKAVQQLAARVEELEAAAT